MPRLAWRERRRRSSKIGVVTRLSFFRMSHLPTFTRTSSLEQAPVLDRGTAIHHDLDARRLRGPRRIEVDDTELAPEDARAFANRRIDDRRQVHRLAEDIDDLDRVRNRKQIRISALAEHLDKRVGLEDRVYRYHAETLVAQQFRDHQTVAPRVVRTSDYGDGRGMRQDGANLVVGRINELVPRH